MSIYINPIVTLMQKGTSKIILLVILLVVFSLIIQKDAHAFGAGFESYNSNNSISEVCNSLNHDRLIGCLFYLIEGPFGATVMLASLMLSILILIFKKGKGKYVYAGIFLLISLAMFYARARISLFKPVIYLYPEKTQEVHVQLEYEGRLTVTYPQYDPSMKGWKVIAHPDGKLINSSDSREYSYLFWEGVLPGKAYKMPTTGYVVKGEDSAVFLQNILRDAGLKPVEYNEFIVFWYPQIKDFPYVQIAFAGQEYEDSAKLTINPKPDSVLRIFVYFKKLTGEKEIQPQTIKEFKREGFSVVEWGGTIIH